MTRLKFELREHIRFLSDYEIMSKDWLRMAESLHQIANVAFMETHLPPSETNPLLQKGKKGTGTLWDQERDELAVRILLEEGKLNLALRILHKFKELSRNTEAYTTKLKETKEQYNSDMVTVTDRCRVFEQSLGVLLKYAFGHIEALQIMDTPEFFCHIGEVIETALNSDQREAAAEDDKMQETLVLNYLASVSLNMEEMDEDRVMELINKQKIFPNLCALMKKSYQSYRLDALQCVGLFFNGCMDSEAFRTEPELFVKDESAMKLFIDLKGLFIHALENKSFPKEHIAVLLRELQKYEKKLGYEAKITPLDLTSADK